MFKLVFNALILIKRRTIFNLTPVVRQFLFGFLSVVSLLSISLVSTQLAYADQVDIKAIALFNGKAMLSINGAKAKILSAGQVSQGVTLVSSSTESAQIKVGDKVESIFLNSSLLLDSSLAQKPINKDFIQLWSDDSGFFFAPGNINGRSAQFLVDTGANLVVFSGQQFLGRLNMQRSGNQMMLRKR